ncbi:hypothetical protein AU252_20060 [Pseudarthrobacter sulfonivorans]|uniref:Uncharacterized protein n=1 Tax=Pseudarthrobacter sulfonivorans TaxID=121292 RepID=A0A0U2XHD3_9MICC|nr:hypothetical protein [Pseudarthrobacter sulfonivorans]ALV43170.1 hypothetical protein AU252_20060 [Pseudarthrobacter sulfonivorans]
MSQEKPPVRSRRELRQARDENTAPGSNGPGQVSPASKQRRAADAPVDSVPEQSQAQRSSQIRARDRAALRAIKELEEKEGQLSAGGPPTRRQLRLQQLKEQAVTSANPIIPAPMGQPLPSQPAPRQSGPSQPKPGQAKPAPTKPAPTKPGQDTAVSADMAGPAAPANGAGVPAGMSVEQALAARTLIAEQAKNQLAKMEHIASLDPEAVDPDILAEQIALAERAAVLNRRAMAKRKLAEQAAPAQPVSVPTQAANPQAAATQSVPQTGPATADNLAMVTPLEFVQVPGVDRPVMKPPATSYVPLATQAGPKVRPGGKGRRPSTTSKEPAAGSAQAAASGRSRVIARAEAAARAAAAPKRVVPVQPTVADTPMGEPDDLFDDLPRIPARSAHGLEPLDAATAGLARAKRLRLMQVLVLAFGIVALISGVILIVSGISS